MPKRTIVVPATDLAPAVSVELDTESGAVSLDGSPIGVVWQGEASAWVAVAGHRGRIGNSVTVADWRALTVEEQALPRNEQRAYSGDVFRAHQRKNTRKAALAYLVARAAGASWSDARYFHWAR